MVGVYTEYLALPAGCLDRQQSLVQPNELSSSYF